MSVVFIFAECPPDELLGLKRFGYLLASTADCQGVDKVNDIEAYIQGKFAMVIGSEELAKRLDVGRMTWDEALDFLKWVRLASGKHIYDNDLVFSMSTHGEDANLRQYVSVLVLNAILISIITNLLSFEIIELPLELTLELLLVFSLIVTLLATWSFLQRNLASVKIEGFTKVLLMLGLTLAFTGFVTPFYALLAGLIGFKRGLGEFLNLYTHISLNFLLGGLSLIGASLTALQSLSKHGASQPPQCSGEGGGSQQSK